MTRETTTHQRSTHINMAATESSGKTVASGTITPSGRMASSGEALPSGKYQRALQMNMEPNPDVYVHHGPAQIVAETNRQPDSLDGCIHAELFHAPVTYHICWWDSIDADFHMMAMTACRIACAAADVMRGRPVPAPIKRQLTEPCLRKLVNVAALLDHHLQSYPEQRVALRRSPAIPMWAHGMFINDTKLDIIVGLSLGARRYSANIILLRVGSRWICDYADLG